MAERYCYPDAGGNDSGSSWINAHPTLQGAIDAWNVGDTIWCRPGVADYDAGAQIDIDDDGGAETSTWVNPMKIVGVNSGTTNEPPEAGDMGTDRFVITGVGNGVDILVGDGTQDFIWLVNIELKEGDADGLYFSGTTTYLACINCRFEDNDNHGMSIDNVSNLYAKQCICSNNDIGAYRPPSTGIFVACRFVLNTLDGVQHSTSSPGRFWNCVFEQNSDGATVSGTSLFMNCVFDDNNDGIDGSPSFCIIIGCRFTNNAGESIDTSSGDEFLVDYIYSESAEDTAGPMWKITDKTMVETAVFGGSDTGDGYIGGEFNLDPDEATYFSEELVIPVS